jgi:hypothetical protein
MNTDAASGPDMNQAPPRGLAGSSRQTTGLLLIVLGLIFLGETHHGILGWSFTFGRLWPLLLIVLGLAKLMGPNEARVSAEPQVARAVVEERRSRPESPKQRHGKNSFAGGAWLIFVGFLFLLHTYGVLTLDRSWPLFIVWTGVTIMFAHRFSHHPTSGTSADPEIPSPPVPPPAPPMSSTPPVSSTPPEPPAGPSQP